VTGTLHPLEGHQAVRRALARARSVDTLPASLLVHGAPGVGKQRLALWFGRLSLCTEPSVEEGPCGRCHSCRLALRLEHPDIHWHFPLERPRGATSPEKLADALEEARAEELAELRERPLRPRTTGEARAHYLAGSYTLRRRAHRKPSMSREQVFVIGDAETLVPQESSPEAANALLKMLEEPPSATRFVLTSSEPRRLLPTIRSRCFPLHLAPLEGERVERFLTSVAGASADEARRAARLGQGSIGRALGFLPEGDEAGPLEQLRLQALGLVQAAVSGDPGADAKAALDFGPAGARGLLDLFSFVEEWLRDLAAIASGAGRSVVHDDHRETLERLAAPLEATALTGSLRFVEDAREEARGNVNPQLIVAVMLARLRRHVRSARGVA